MSKKKYSVITKIDTKRFVKYRVNSLRKYKVYIQKRFPDWKFTNVYLKSNRTYIGSFTCRNNIYGNIDLRF
jgi:hypothetical protein